ncbi:hypothetical protein ABZV24_36095 [Streptomyces sp. NPDC005251]|uniref:hypothetical protein n=1 Tax=Streptomyces sp. NPDC005251 TaxID=3157166 RepID=UPI0033AB5A94
MAGTVQPPHASRAGRPVMKNRQGASWFLEAQPWSPGNAFAEVTGRLGQRGLKAPDRLEALVRQLVAAVVADGGRHVSLHLAEQDNQARVLAFQSPARPVAAAGRRCPGPSV